MRGFDFEWFIDFNCFVVKFDIVFFFDFLVKESMNRIRSRKVKSEFDKIFEF